MAQQLQAVVWTGTGVRVIDQTRLPGQLVYLDIDTVDELVAAIRRLSVRGAPALGVAGALGVVVAMRQADREGWSAGELARAIDRLRGARPTAVNLAWAVDQVAPLMPDGAAVLAAALRIQEQDAAANRAIGRLGADWLQARLRRPALRVLTHCNAGALATSAWGTALGIVRELHERTVLEVVYVDETRPLLQGARLTAWELAQAGIPHLVQVDAAAAGTVVGGLVDVAIVGADRVAANGDIANKVGTLGIALACQYAQVPFLVAAPESTVDLGTASGASIRIEMRDDEEVLVVAGQRSAPAESRAHNPAFDITPARLVTALVTEQRVLAIAAGQVPAGTNTR
jgi:methylthioribose-1-phosphate isomerase